MPNLLVQPPKSSVLESCKFDIQWCHFLSCDGSTGRRPSRTSDCQVAGSWQERGGIRVSGANSLFGSVPWSHGVNYAGGSYISMQCYPAMSDLGISLRELQNIYPLSSYQASPGIVHSDSEWPNLGASCCEASNSQQGTCMRRETGLHAIIIRSN